MGRIAPNDYQQPHAGYFMSIELRCEWRGEGEETFEFVSRLTLAQITLSSQTARASHGSALLSKMFALRT